MAINLTEDQQRKNDAARQQLQANREFQGRIVEGAATGEGIKPTPTQEENDLAKLGAYVPEHEPDGSQEQPQGSYADPRGPGVVGGAPTNTRTMEAGRQKGQYQTRAAAPAPGAPNPNQP